MKLHKHRFPATSPLPPWRSFVFAGFKILGFSSSKLPSFDQSWHPHNKKFWTNRTSTSLFLIIDAFRKVFNYEKICVWVPDYFCDSSLGPIKNPQTTLYFYPLDNNMRPDWCAIGNVEFPKPHVFIVTHYFGSLTVDPKITTFCKQHNALLIEDAAHRLDPINHERLIGDFVLYSPHKHLPIPDGGLIVKIDNGPLGFRANPEVSIGFEKSLTLACSCLPYSFGFLYVWLIKRIFLIIGYKPVIRRKKFIEDETSSASRNISSMSQFAKYLIVYEAKHLNRIKSQRLINYRMWKFLLGGFKGIAPISLPSSEEDCPYLGIFEASSDKLTQEYFDRLMSLGFPALTWPDLPSAVRRAPKLHAAAISMRMSRIFLPLLQSNSPKNFRPIIKNITSQLTSGWRLEEVSLPEWNKYFGKCKEVNLLQSSCYGQAKNHSTIWRVRRFIAFDCDSRPIGLIQAMELKLPVIGGICHINRGPLLINEQSTPFSDAFYKILLIVLFLKNAKSMGYRAVQMAPELPDVVEVTLALEALGLKKIKRAVAWGSATLDLTESEGSLLGSISSKWRGSLKKGAKLGVEVIQSSNVLNDLDGLFKSYLSLQRQRGFTGLPESLIRQLAINSENDDNFSFILYVAFADNDFARERNPLGFLVSIITGGNAFYFLGSTSIEGRGMQANYVLLWRAILDAKRLGCKSYDLGGLNADTVKGVADFKRGLNGKSYLLTGHWRAVTCFK